MSSFPQLQLRKIKTNHIFSGVSCINIPHSVLFSSWNHPRPPSSYYTGVIWNMIVTVKTHSRLSSICSENQSLWWVKISTIAGRPGYAVIRIFGIFQNFYAVIFIMRICGYPHNFVSWFAPLRKNSFNSTQFESFFS